MARVPHIVRKRKKSRIIGKPNVINHQDIAAMQVDTRLDLIRALIPIGLSYVAAELDQEVVNLAGVRHSRKADLDTPRRHGTNPGSVKAGHLVGSGNGAWGSGDADHLLSVSSKSASLAHTLSWFPFPATSNRT